MKNEPNYIKRVNRRFAILSYILSILITIFVFLTGGTTKVYTNLMYIPIATISSSNGKIKGIIHALISGLLLGPYMPLSVELGILQNPINWIIRLIIYVIIALIIGLISDYNKESKKHITNLLTHDVVTELKNIEAIKRDDTFDSGHKTIIAVSVKEHKEMLNFFGYDFTNEAILKFSRKLRKALYRYKKVELYKYDGMEFVVIVTHDGEDIKISEIMRSLSHMNKSTIMVDEIPLYIEIIMGMANIKDDVTILEGVRQALVSLRYAIDNGSKLEVFDDSLEEHFNKIVSIASNFRTALDKGEIKIAYQNIYCTKTGNIHGMELLTRWMSGDKVVYGPGEFIPVIEKTELINEVVKLMIDKAVFKLLKERFEETIISINFSPKDFKDEVIDYLIGKFDSHKIDPSRLQIEITEEVFINKDEVVKYLNKIRKYGVKIAIDDFGSGYSSYQYLSDLPIDVIKIDRSMIEKMEHSEISKSIVKSIVGFSKVNGMKTVAEGVENLETVIICKGIGIDYIQGYYYHRPTILE